MTQEEIEQILEADIQFAIADLWRQLASGEMTPASWRAQMGDLLAQYLTAAWILGEGSADGELIDPDGLRAYIEAQFAFLDNFASQLEVAITERRRYGFVGVPGYDGYTIVVNDDGSITIIDASGNEVDGGNVFVGYRTLNGGRAGMYGDAMWGAYQTGKITQIGAGTKYGLHLPAMPGDGSTPCKTRDRCSWLIIPLNIDEGEYDAYWTLGQAEHCPTCVQRAADWNPLYIWHGWPSYRVKSIKEKIEEIALKHRQGMHNQKRHGNRMVKTEIDRKNTLSDDEKKAVYSYSGDRFSQINQTLRTGKEIEAQDTEIIKTLDRVLERSRLEKDAAVYRGAELYKMDGEAPIDLRNSVIKIGASFKDMAYSSTSKSEQTASGFSGLIAPVTFVIKLPKGAKALDMESFSSRPYEKEILLPRGQKFIITNIQKTGSDILDSWTVEMEIVP